ncbi:MurR/RpiR family transcriptional regulator [Dryocola sp. BD586]|uniref:MurR/RpiR family transcriptional regulator n=1 Tax=Dryocola sp. BD586 TaxID=3133271 RepID=UPI003F50B22A
MTDHKKNKNRVDVYGERLRSRAPQLSAGLQTVLHYINENRSAVLESTALEIASATNTSDATVVRAVQALGFAGLRDLKKTLELWFEPVMTSTDKMSITLTEFTGDVDSSINFVLEGHKRACEVLSSPANRVALSQAVSLLLDARQVAIFGINASGILAEYTARLFNRIGLPCAPLNRSGVGLAEQLLTLQRGDVLVMMAQKSAHREGMTTLREAKRLGMPVILLTNALDSRFAQEADVVIQVPRGGENGKVPLHGTVLICLEMLVLSVASSASQRTIKSMKRMQELHRGLKTGGHKRQEKPM